MCFTFDPDDEMEGPFPTLADVPQMLLLDLRYYRPNDSSRKTAKVDRWLAWFGRRCPTCNVLMKRELDDNGGQAGCYPTLDHILSRKSGGPRYDPANLMVVCRDCNSLKAKNETSLRLKINDVHGTRDLRMYL